MGTRGQETMKQTKEQELIVHEAGELEAGQVLKINAGAGTGKTSSLVMVSEKVIEPSLLLVFNKAAQLEAAEKFPRHVVCRTTHSIAYGVTGIKIAHKLSRPKAGYVNVAYTGAEVAKYFKITPRQISQDKVFPASYIGLLTRMVVTRFEQSADRDITKQLISKFIRDTEKEYDVSLTDFSTDLIALAKKLWKERIDPNSVVLATHDTYLKMYQLSNPVLNYDVIYLDEAQDSNPCVVDIVSKQKNVKLVIVGDERQAIYQWRGAINAMKTLNGKTLNLSTSFRYGQDVADIANKILEGQYNLVSLEGLHTEVGENVVDSSKVYTVLYRTNSRLILDAVDSLAKGKTVNLEIDVRDFCNLLSSAAALFKGDLSKVKHEDLLCFNDWNEFKVEAEQDKSYERIMKLIESGTYIRVITILENHKNVSNPDIIFTTAHKSKGREWEQVKLADDYPSHYNKDREWVGLSIEDQNLLYVAATRAKKALDTNPTIRELSSNNFRQMLSGILNSAQFRDEDWDIDD